MEKKILSIQSHVVSGYVGNRCAVFPLQLLGYEVDFINSCQLSTHTKYEVFKGQVLNENDLRTLLDGLSQNDLDHYAYLLTGYVRNALFLQEIINVFHHLKAKNPDLLYICDPVLGDNGELYVPKELVPVYRNQIVPIADIIMPNRYELEWLIERKVNSVQDALEGIEELHSKGCKVVVITSAEFSEGILTVIGSSNFGDTKVCAAIEIEKLNVDFVGTGDLFGALFLAWMDKSEKNLVVALENTVASLHSVIHRTYAYAQSAIRGSESEKLELKLVQSKEDIEHPKVLYKAKILHVSGK